MTSRKAPASASSTGLCSGSNVTLVPIHWPFTAGSKNEEISMLNVRSIVAFAAAAVFVVPLLVTQNVSAAERHGPRVTKHQTTSAQVRGAYAAVDAVQSNWSRATSAVRYRHLLVTDRQSRRKNERGTARGRSPACLTRALPYLHALYAPVERRRMAISLIMVSAPAVSAYRQPTAARIASSSIRRR